MASDSHAVLPDANGPAEAEYFQNESVTTPSIAWLLNLTWFMNSIL